MALLLLPLYLALVMCWYLMLFTASILAATCYFLFYWFPVRVWQTRPRATAPQLSAAHLWGHRSARDELRRVRALPTVYAPAPPRAPEECVQYGGHTYYRPTIDRAWAAGPTKLLRRVGGA